MCRLNADGREGYTVAILWLGDDACHADDLVGGKAATLSRLAAEFPVPAGFAVPAVSPAIDESQAAAIGEEVVDAYLQLEQRAEQIGVPVAVRSSAVDEDGPSASFAGQHDTYLNVRGAEAVFEAVRRCWASAHSEVALAYRRQQGLDMDNIRIAVLVQRLVSADVAGVAFSANPITGSRDEVMINASWGLGESVVSGTVTPDMYIVHRQTQTVTVELGAKERMTVLAVDGTRETPVPGHQRNARTLTDDQAVNVATLAARLEQSMGWPVDVEFAFRDGVLSLLQCRPITTLP